MQVRKQLSWYQIVPIYVNVNHVPCNAKVSIKVKISQYGVKYFWNLSVIIAFDQVLVLWLAGYICYQDVVKKY